MKALLKKMVSVGVIGMGIGLAATTHAADWPTKPIRFIIPFTAGGSGGETVARLVADKLTQQLGQSVILEYKPGAGGMIGSSTVANAEPDGYTIGLISDSHVITPALQAQSPFDPVGDFAPITQLVRFPMILVANNGTGFKTTNDLIAAAKANPGKLAYGSGGPGSAHHLAMAMLERKAGIEMVHVPYKSGAASFTDVMGGHVDSMFMGLTASMPQIQAGNVVGLGLSSVDAQPAAPGVPAIAESALPGFEYYVWLGMLAPAGTPDEIVQRLNREVAQAFNSDEVKTYLSQFGFEVKTSSPEDFTEFLGAESSKFSELINSIGLQN